MTGPLFQNLSFQIERGERWGILGPNGTGKSTLLKCLLGRVAADQGESRFGTHVDVGYFDQQLAGLDGRRAGGRCHPPAAKEFTEPQRREMLARVWPDGRTWFFNGVGASAAASETVRRWRGSPRSDANFLILDEPTNHLDLVGVRFARTIVAASSQGRCCLSATTAIF